MRATFLFCLLCPVTAFCQRPIHLTLFGGFSNYQGDLQEKVFTIDQSNPAFGAGLKYDLDDHWALRAGFMYGKVQASDSKNSKPDLRARNLSFATKIAEGNLLAEYTLFNMEERVFSPFAFAGLAVYHFNPYAFDSAGNKIYLQPLSTEGEGLSQYPDRKPYKLTQLAIPFGLGIKLRITQNTVLAYEVSFRKLFTDHLDDVSTNYVDRTVLAQARGAKAVEMAYRGGELKNGNPAYPAEGTKRGSPKYKDWYYFSGFTLYIQLNGAGGRHRGLGCPRRVF